MAKLTVLFLFAFIAVQCIAAGIVKRDAPSSPANEAQKNFENALEQMQKFIKTTFTKENLEKFNQDIQQFGETLSAKGKQLVEEANANINNLKNTQ